MDDLGVRFLYNVVKEYPDMIKITIYHEPKCYTIPDRAKRSAEKVNDDVYTPSVSSLSRTKTLIKDIIICNEFEYFCTFTFDPAKVDSFNFGQCRRVMSIWLHHQRDVAREKGKIFKYIIVPEQETPAEGEQTTEGGEQQTQTQTQQTVVEEGNVVKEGE